MTFVGVVAIAVATTSALLALRGDSPVERWLRILTATPRARGGQRGFTMVESRAVGAFAGAMVGCALAAILPLGALPVGALAYAGWLAPAVIVERRDAGRRRKAERAVVTLVEWTHALVASGRPLETAVADVAARNVLSGALAESIGRARRDYILGVPMHDALLREASVSGNDALRELAVRLDQARDLGRGALPLLQELRDDLRARERADALGAAAAVEGKLTAVMTLCYLPALALLVIVPLFVTLLSGLFGP
jgi:tight adherence protein C